MLQCRRDKLENVSIKQAEHAGLWFDKYLSKQLVKNEQVPTGGSTPQQRLVEECATIKEPDSYRMFYKRWQETLASCGAQTKEADVQGRLAIGLGDESVIETAITLHQTYGVPYIPGSALKGLAASFARQHLTGPAWQQDGEAYQILFGTLKGAGFITFFDALYVPGSGLAGQALYPDVITVHHPDYYQQGEVAPADWDNPNPVSFLSATGKYLIALAGPAKWLNATFRILELALVRVGVGAKTSAGYGYFQLLEPQAGQEKQGAVTTGTESAASRVTESIQSRRGFIIEIRPDRHFGRVRDEETGKEYRFSTDSIEGNTPPKKARVVFELQAGRVLKVRR